MTRLTVPIAWVALAMMFLEGTPVLFPLIPLPPARARCASAAQQSSFWQTANCPSPEIISKMWRLSCAPMCYNESIYYIELTVKGACKQPLFAPYYLHCRPSPPTSTVGSDYFVATGGDAYHTFLGGCGTRWKERVWNCLNCDGELPCDYPLVISLSDNKYELTSIEGGVLFDLNGDGQRQKMSWTALGGDDAFLTLDRNGNGVIDSGVELFSHVTPQIESTTPNGFLGLGLFDNPLNGGNGDSKITSEDKIFKSLRLWHDADQDGETDSGELLTLREVGLMEIDLKYTDDHEHTDANGNVFMYSAPAYFVGGRVVDAWAVFFQSEACSSCSR